MSKILLFDDLIPNSISLNFLSFLQLIIFEKKLIIKKKFYINLFESIKGQLLILNDISFSFFLGLIDDFPINLIDDFFKLFYKIFL